MRAHPPPSSFAHLLAEEVGLRFLAVGLGLNPQVFHVCHDGRENGRAKRIEEE